MAGGGNTFKVNLFFVWGCASNLYWRVSGTRRSVEIHHGSLVWLCHPQRRHLENGGQIPKHLFFFFCCFFCLNVSTCHQNTQTVELKANFSTTLMRSLVTAAGLCHLSVLYNDIDDYRGGWARGRGKGGVDDDVKWMRFQSCQLSEMASLIHQFPLLPKSHVQRTRDKQHVWF